MPPPQRNPHNQGKQTVDVGVFECGDCCVPVVYYHQQKPAWYPLCAKCHQARQPPLPVPVDPHYLCKHAGCQQKRVNCQVCASRVDWDSDFSVYKNIQLDYCARHAPVHAHEHVHRRC